jgi:hypothetical protein
MYTQCRLVRQEEDGLHIQVAYIPKKYAKKDNVVKLMLANGTWEDGWLITDTFSDADDIYTARQSRKRHRKNTGDSLPKEKK